MRVEISDVWIDLPLETQKERIDREVPPPLPSFDRLLEQSSNVVARQPDQQVEDVHEDAP